MKTLFKTIRLFIFVILITSICSNANTATTTTSESNLPKTLVMSSDEFNSTTTSTPSLPARPEKRPRESDASYNNRIRQWETQVRQLTSDYAAQQEAELPRFPGISATPAVDIPHRPSKRSGESDASYNNRIRQWDAEVRRMSAEAQRAATTGISTALPERPDKRAGESDAQYNNRLRQWEAEIRRLNYENRSDSDEIPARPTRRQGESSNSYNDRIRYWEAEVRRIAATASTGISTNTSAIPPRPIRREGEVEDSYNNRIRQWESEVRAIAVKQQKEDELEKLRQELAKLSKQISNPIRTDSYNDTKPESISVVPMGEIGTEKLLTINEDLKIMSQILQNELEIQSKSLKWILKDGTWIPINPNTGTTLGVTANSLSSMYLEGYGVLFEKNLNYPLSVPYEVLVGENQNEENYDSVWERTKQQVLEPKSSPNVYYSRAVHERPEIIDVEKIKASLIKTLKYASNIRSLKPDESVILRIIGAEQSIRVTSMREIEENKYIINYESNGIRNTTVISGNINDKIKSLSEPTVLIIRAKKSDIDAFAKDELDFDKFREKVQVFSYPVFNGNSEKIR